MGKLATSSNARTRRRGVDVSGVAAFDPVTGLGWKHLYYAGGPAFQALGLSNGADMASVNWPDEIATNAAPLDAGNGGYATADSQINSKPSVYTISGLSNKRHSTTVAGGAQVSLPYSVICIFQFDSGRQPSTSTTAPISAAPVSASCSASNPARPGRCTWAPTRPPAPRRQD